MIHIKIEDGRPINLYNNPQCNCGGLCESTTSEDSKLINCNCSGGCKSCNCGKNKSKK